jgi:hypothetical protein
MKLVFASIVILSLFSLGAVGCAEKASVTEETTVSTPGGTTTTTVTKEVEKTGDNPPSEQP